MDILFVDTFIKKESYNFPVGINILSTIVNTTSDYTSEVISFCNLIIDKELPVDILFENNYETIVNYILNKNPKIISFYTLQNSYFISLIVAKNIKEKNKNIKIILAGPQASLCSLETLKTFDFVDLIAIGEGENNVISIIDYFNNKENIENVKGICYKKSNKIICNSPSPLVEDLDKLPILKLNEDTLPNRLNIETGRGCPYNCTFCSTSIFWKHKVRTKSLDRLITEVKYYVTNYNINNFSFIHDLFTARKQHVLEFCNKLIDSELNIKWICSARADTIDEEMISLMARAGCNRVTLGIETGSQRMQKKINKNLNMSKVKDIITLVNKYNINMLIGIIYGFPQEEEEDLLQTIDLVRFCIEEISIKDMLIQKCMPYCGTHIYNTNKDNLVFNEDNFIIDKYPAKQQADFIKCYPNIFSSFYLIDNEILKKYFYLDAFLKHVYQYSVFVLPKTTKEILTYYEDNLLNFYLAYETQIKKIVPLLTRIYFDDELSLSKVMFNSLEDFIKTRMDDEFIEQLFKFEVEMVRASHRKNNKDSKILTFDYDMLAYFEQQKKKKAKCKLLFDITEDKEVKISKIM